MKHFVRALIKKCFAEYCSNTLFVLVFFVLLAIDFYYLCKKILKSSDWQPFLYCYGDWFPHFLRISRANQISGVPILCIPSPLPPLFHWLYSNLYSLSLPRYLWLRLLIQTTPSRYRIRMVEYGRYRDNAYVRCAATGQGRAVLPGCCGVFLQQPSRYQIEMVFPRGFETSRKAHLPCTFRRGWFRRRGVVASKKN